MKRGLHRRFSPAGLLIFVGLTMLLVGAGAWGYQAWDAARVAADVRTRVESLSDDPGAFLLSTATPLPSSTPSPTVTFASRERITPVAEVSPGAATSTSTVSATSIPSPTLPPPSPTPTSTPYPPSPPVRIIIPALGIDSPVVSVGIELVDSDGGLVATWQTADYAAGYHEGSGLPGQPGNVVISGHNNIKGQVFRPISALGNEDVPFPKGAFVYLVDGWGRVFAYVFESMYKLREAGVPIEERIRNARFMAQTSDPVLTLITCWPLNNNTHRIIVRARFVGEVSPSKWKDVVPVR